MSSNPENPERDESIDQPEDLEARAKSLRGRLERIVDIQRVSETDPDRGLELILPEIRSRMYNPTIHMRLKLHVDVKGEIERLLNKDELDNDDLIKIGEALTIFEQGLFVEMANSDVATPRKPLTPKELMDLERDAKNISNSRNYEMRLKLGLATQ